MWLLSPGDPSLVRELAGHSELVHYVAIDQVNVIIQNDSKPVLLYRTGSTAAISQANCLFGPERRRKR